MVYVIKVGKVSRRGTFSPEVIRYIDAGSNDFYEVKKYFGSLYRGFFVSVDEVKGESIEHFTPSTKPGSKAPEAEPKRIYKIDEFPVALTAPRFKTLFDAAKDSFDKYTKNERLLIEEVAASISTLKNTHSHGAITVDYHRGEALVGDLYFRNSLAITELADFSLDSLQE